MNTNNRGHFLINAAYFIFIAAVIFLSYKYLLSFLLPFLIALLIGYLVQKPSQKLAKKLRCKPRTVAPVMALLIYLAVGAVIFSVVFYLFSNFQPAITGISDTLTQATNIFSGAFNKYSAWSRNLPEEIRYVLENLPKNIAERAMSFLTSAASDFISFAAKNIPSFFFSSLITVMASIYFARDFSAVKSFIMSVISETRRESLTRIKNILFSNVFKMAKGYGVLILITFAEITVGFLIIGVKNAVFYAAIISVIDALPVLGVGIVLIPWAVISIISGNLTFGIMLAILYVITAVVRNILEPKILSSKLGIPPLLSLLIIFCGLKLFGFFGMIVAFISLVIFIDYYREEKV